MSLHPLADHDDMLEVLAHLHQDRQGNVVAHFVDASGNKILVRFSQQVALDLYEELGEALSLD